MSASKWKWTPECDRGICIGDCDRCDRAVDDKEEAFKTVLEELKKIRLFTGLYDARKGNDQFMYGVQMVMEHIAYMAGEYEGFDDMFTKNLFKSMDKAEYLLNIDPLRDAEPIPTWRGNMDGLEPYQGREE